MYSKEAQEKESELIEKPNLNRILQPQDGRLVVVVMTPPPFRQIGDDVGAVPTYVMPAPRGAYRARVQEGPYRRVRDVGVPLVG